MNPVLLASSGGKDSLLALDVLLSSGRWHLSALLATVWTEPDGSERIAGHGIPLSLLSAQAEALALPLRLMRIPPGADDQRYASALAEALEEVAWLDPGLSHIAFGDLHLQDIRAFRETLLARLGWEPLFPLWGISSAEAAERFLARGFRALVVAADPRRLPQAFLGREYDRRFLAELPPGCDPCGENGEFHTFVWDGPRFRHPLRLRALGIREREGLCTLELSLVASA